MPAYKDKKSGKWYCKFYYKDWTGTQRQKWKRGFQTKRDAQQFERNFLQKQATDPDITLGNLYSIYMEEMRTRLKESTLSIKKNICETKILPYFSDKPMNEITAVDIRRWQNSLIQEHQFSGTYLKTINNQMTALVNYARRYYNLGTNPCEQAGSIGTSTAGEMKYWTLEEFMRFREGLRDDYVAYTCFEVLYWTGMRLGELLALSTQDVDFVNQEINIDKTYQRVKGEDVFTSPKTEKSKRRVPIPEFLCQEIQSYIDKQPKEKISKRLFPYNRAYLTNELKKSCQMTGVRRIRVHDIRHSHVSLLINQGFDALVIARRVGHEKVSTTLNTYAHLFPHKQERLVSVLEGLGKENEIILVAK